MPTADATAPESRTFEADVAQLLRLMVHSVYSDRDVFLRELISNAADACERLRFEAIADPALAGDGAKPRITLLADPEARRLTVEDNGIGMSRDEMVEALGTIARSGTRAFVDRIAAAQGGEGAGQGAQLIGQFGVGFYSAFMVADRVEVVSRRAGSAEAALWSSDGQGSFSIAPADAASAPARGTRVVLHLKEDAAAYAERYTLERIVRAQSGHVPVPIALVEKPGAEPAEIADGAALWVKPRAEITPEEYTDFYRSVAGQFDEPALTVHVRAEGRHEYTVLAFVPGSRPFDLFDPDRHGRMKLYVRRVFITDEAEVLPRWLRFVRGLVDSADLPLNVSREMIQESPILGAIRKGVTNRVVSELEKLAQSDPEAYAKVWDTFGAVLKEGLYEDFERRPRCSASPGSGRPPRAAAGARSRTTPARCGRTRPRSITSPAPISRGSRRRRSSKGSGRAASRSCSCPTRSTASGSRPASTTRASRSSRSPRGPPTSPSSRSSRPAGEQGTAPEAVAPFIAAVKAALGDAVSDVRASERLTESAVCLVAPESGLDRQLERLLARSGQLGSAAKPVLELNPRHELIAALAALGEDERALREDAAHLLLDEARILDGNSRPMPGRSRSAWRA